MVSEETLIAYEVLYSGYRLAYSYGHSQDYDLIADVDSRLLKIQVKTGINTRKRQYEMRLRDKDEYDADHVDLFASAAHPENAAFYAPFDQTSESQRVTFTPPAEMSSDANRERANMTEDYSLEAVLPRVCNVK